VTIPGNEIRIERRTLLGDTWSIVELAIAQGKSVTITDCVIKDDVALGAKFANEEPASTSLTQQARAYFGNPATARVIRGKVAISDSFLVTSIVVSPAVVVRSAASSNTPIVFLQAPELVNNMVGGHGILFVDAVFPGWPKFRGNRLRTGSPGLPFSGMKVVDSWFSEKLTGEDFSDNDLDLDFSHVFFNRGVRFDDSKFSRSVHFRDETVFHENASFDSAVFEGTADFSHAKFFAGNFANAHFKEFVSFKGSTIEETLSLRGVMFNAGGDFAAWTLAQKALLDLTYTRGQRYLLGITWREIEPPVSRYYNFILEDSTRLRSEYDKDPESFIEAWRDQEMARGNWPKSREETKKTIETILSSQAKAISGTLLRREKISALKFLENNFREAGLKDDAFNAFRERKVLEREDQAWYSRPIDFVFRLTCGYGTQWKNIVVTAAICILLFAFLYYPFQVWRGGVDPAESKLHRFLESLIFSTHIFVRVGYAGWEPKSHERWTVPFVIPLFSRRPFSVRVERRSIQVPVNFHLITTIQGTIGWVVLAVFTATLARVWIE